MKSYNQIKTHTMVDLSRLVQPRKYPPGVRHDFSGFRLVDPGRAAEFNEFQFFGENN